MTKSPPFTPQTFWLFVAIIFFTSLVLYWPQAKMGFILDDDYVIARNPIIKTPSLYPKIFSSGLFAASHQDLESELHYYRPLLTASYIPDYLIWKDDAFGYRLTNIFIHALNCILVFLLLLLVFENVFLAGLAALIFCVLPVHEWVVRYIVGRGDLLQAFFSLISCTAIAYYLRRERARWLWVSLIAGAAALLCREASVANVLYIGLITWWMTKNFKKTLILSLPFLALGIAYCILRAIFFPIQDFSLITAQDLLLIPSLLAKLFFPFSPLMALFLVVLAITLIYLVGKKKNRLENRNIVFFAFLWMITVGISLTATRGMLERLGPVLVDHFLYFPSVGFALFWALLIKQSRIKKTLFIATLVFFLSLVFYNGHFWQNEEMLLRHVQSIEEKKFTVAYEQVAMRYENNEQVIRELVDHAATDSGRSLWQKRLGNLYRREKNYPQAITALQEAIRLHPANVEAINELAVVHLESGNEPLGAAYLKQSLQVDPHGAEAYRLLGIVAYRKNDFSSAADLFQKSLVYNPEETESSLYLTMAYFFTNNQAAYSESLEKVLAQVSDTRPVLKFIAFQLFNHGLFSETVKLLEPTKNLFTNDPDTLNILAQAQKRLIKE